MKNGFITVLSAAIVAAMVLLTGCIEVTDEEGEGPVEFWDSAYDYEAVVNTTDGEQGKVSTFSYTEVIIEARKKRSETAADGSRCRENNGR